MRTCHIHGKHLAVGLVTGLCLIALGTVFLLQNLGMVPFGMTLRIWPAVLLVLAAASFARHGLLSVGGHALVLGAVALQLKHSDHAALLQHGWPVALIWIGAVKVLRVLWRRSRQAAPACWQDGGQRLS